MKQYFIYWICASYSQCRSESVMFLDPSCSLDKKKIWWSNSNVPAIFLHYPHHLQTPSLIIHEEYLYGDISLHFSYHPQCSANRDTEVYFRSQREWFHKSQSSLSVCLFFLAESNYKMPQLPILSQEWVIKERGLSCPRLHQVIGELQRD